LNKDPSQVKKIEPFDGALDIPADAPVRVGAVDMPCNILAGYNSDPDVAVRTAVARKKDFERADRSTAEALKEFIRNLCGQALG
jgi:hypothetical protein